MIKNQTFILESQEHGYIFSILKMTTSDLETTTAELLARKWEETYGLLAKINQIVESNPEKTKALLAEHPQFTRALFQAQLMLGIADLEVADEEQQLADKVLQMTRQEFDQLDPEMQKEVSRIRTEYNQSPIPPE